jgi:aldose 1-epimerase
MSINKLELIKLENGSFSSQILANYGAALNSYCLGETEFIDGYRSPENIINQQYKGVILAPFPNRVAQAEYIFNQKNYVLDVNRAKEGLALHGFLYKCSFDILEQSKTHCKLFYQYKASENGFPFPFELEIEYNLKIDGRLEVASKIKNTGSVKMPFGLGWHPYFKIGESIDALQLNFPAAKQLELDNAKIPTGNITDFTQKAKCLNLKDYSFDDCFSLSNQGINSFVLQGDNVQLEISADSTHFPFFQIYTPKDRGTIAIEPMTCAPNAFNNEIGIKVLSPQELVTAIYYVKASSIND